MRRYERRHRDPIPKSVDMPHCLDPTALNLVAVVEVVVHTRTLPDMPEDHGFHQLVDDAGRRVGDVVHAPCRDEDDADTSSAETKVDDSVDGDDDAMEVHSTHLDVVALVVDAVSDGSLRDGAVVIPCFLVWGASLGTSNRTHFVAAAEIVHFEYSRTLDQPWMGMTLV